MVDYAIKLCVINCFSLQLTRPTFYVGLINFYLVIGDAVIGCVLSCQFYNKIELNSVKKGLTTGTPTFPVVRPMTDTFIKITYLLT